MKVAVVGGTGFLGRAIVSALRRQRIPTVVISRNPLISRTNIDIDQNTRSHANDTESLVTYLRWDVTRDPSLDTMSEWRAKMHNVTVVVHAVGSLMDSSAYKQWVKQPQQALGSLINDVTRVQKPMDLYQIQQRYASSSSGHVQKDAYKRLNRDSCTVMFSVIRI